MLYVGVRFPNSSKIYTYKTRLQFLEINEQYNIVADDRTTYSSPITVVQISETLPKYKELRTITKATRIGQKKISSEMNIQQLYVNMDKQTTTLKWEDGIKTTIKCGPNDKFDYEKAIALCFMKRQLGNTGHFNDIIRKLIENRKEYSKT